MNRHLAKMALLLALAVIMGYLEALFPLLPAFPGIKLGLANYIIVLILYLYGIKEASLISFLRIVLVGFMLSNLSMILYSLAGAVCSLAIMYLLKGGGRSSVYGVSALGGVLHNAGQLAVAGILVGIRAILWYIPILLIAGMLAGLLIGLLVSVTYDRIKRISGES